ncbi:MAG: hypothetical protein EOP38_20805 [Rubrivivax sp.]|nr:MAG: hypothetical protein EOP38_20805 [Rubrivivax sp.]
MKPIIPTIALALLCCTPNAWSAVAGEVEGIPVEDSYMVDGGKLVLNGAGMRKRAYFKTDVTSIYLSAPRNSIEGIEAAPGGKRIHLVILRDIPGSTASRYFINDFKAVATDAEFKQLINEIGQLGEIYSKIRQVNKGDVFNIDWVPGKGISSSLNGKPMVLDGNPATYMNNELMYRLMVRMYLTSGGSSEMRENLLGRSRSMLNPPRTP